MAAKAVQISIDSELLRKIDRDPETRRRGRSAFVRSAVELYLAAKDRRRIDEELVAAYEGKADEMLSEIAELLPTQEWPSD
ncbi:MAG TPA: ribbon-helix-helix protein, CopG family [Thermoanaerobaculia bacterium]|nr:ribbon-helix-helix protein, CopG family [Thermoanaerobaculia bacterium]